MSGINIPGNVKSVQRISITMGGAALTQSDVAISAVNTSKTVINNSGLTLDTAAFDDHDNCLRVVLTNSTTVAFRRSPYAANQASAHCEVVEYY